MDPGPGSGELRLVGGTPEETASVRQVLTEAYRGWLDADLERSVHGWRVFRCSLVPGPRDEHRGVMRLHRINVEDVLNDAGFSVISDNSFGVSARSIKLYVHRESSTTQRAKLQEFVNQLPAEWGNLRVDITVTQDLAWSVATMSDPWNWDPAGDSIAGRVSNTREMMIAAFRSFGIEAAGATAFVFSIRADLFRDAGPEELEYR